MILTTSLIRDKKTAAPSQTPSIAGSPLRHQVKHEKENLDAARRTAEAINGAHDQLRHLLSRTLNGQPTYNVVRTQGRYQLQYFANVSAHSQIKTIPIDGLEKRNHQLGLFNCRDTILFVHDILYPGHDSALPSAKLDQ